jgi:branched-chain amino acid transport system permease protein
MPLVLFLAAIGLLALVPRWMDSPYGLHVMILFFMAVNQGAAWNVVGGYTGQYSVGHAAYFGIGAYTTLMLLQFKQVPPWWGVWVAVVLAVSSAASPSGCEGPTSCSPRSPWPRSSGSSP